MPRPRPGQTTFCFPGLSTAGEAEPRLCLSLSVTRLHCVCLGLQGHGISPLSLLQPPAPGPKHKCVRGVFSKSPSWFPISFVLFLLLLCDSLGLTRPLTWQEIRSCALKREGEYETQNQGCTMGIFLSSPSQSWY